MFNQLDRGGAMRKSVLAFAVLASLATAPAFASIDTYAAFLYGANEFPAADPDGFGAATLTIDNIADTVSWAFLALNIDLPLTGAHIHNGAAGVNGPVIVDFSGSLTGSGLFDVDLSQINPSTAAGFYVNLHNAAYPKGAIRGQLQYVGTASLPPVPEPGSYALLLAGLGVVGWAARRGKRESG
jgi:hypothetical protein